MMHDLVQVFKTTEPAFQRMVAVNKSRVSLHQAYASKARGLRPPVAPRPFLYPVYIYAYGRFKNFEYLSMNLLGRNVAQSNSLSLETMALIVNQMVRSYRHCFPVSIAAHPQSSHHVLFE
jgi:hypothetical protein